MIFSSHILTYSIKLHKSKGASELRLTNSQAQHIDNARTHSVLMNARRDLHILRDLVIANICEQKSESERERGSENARKTRYYLLIKPKTWTKKNQHHLAKLNEPLNICTKRAGNGLPKLWPSTHNTAEHTILESSILNGSLL